MDHKTWISGILGTVAGAVIVGALAWIFGAFEAGTDALNKEQIRAVVKEVMVTDAGKTYAETLAELNITLGSMNTRLSALETSATETRAAILLLATE